MAVNMGKNKIKNDSRQLIRMRDAVIIVFLLAASFAVYALRSGASGSGSAAEVSFDGEVIGTIPLSADGEYSFPQLEGMVFTVSEGTVRVSESGCSDRICVKSGRLSRPGEAAVCVPNRAAVEVVGPDEKNNDVDVVVR